MKKHKQTRKLSSAKIIIGTFLGMITVGTLLLMLPLATRESGHASFIDALFTATSASCVTGLVVQDTATYWSVFGQLVILAMIQVGGMGVITFAVILASVAGRKIGFSERQIMTESISAPSLGGIVGLTRYIITTTAVLELSGAVLLLPVYLKENDFLHALWYSLFTAISCFCNAGFDLNGGLEKYSSMTRFEGDILLNVVLMVLIIVGGLGFLVWNDIRTNRLRFKRYRLQSKLVLLTSLILIVLPAVYFFCAEYAGEPLHLRLLHSLFQSVTARTAGFNTADLNQMSPTGKAIMMVLMMIGGSPGSTAGGMKTTTVAVIMLTAFSVYTRKSATQAFRRRIPEETVRNALGLLVMYISLFLVSGILISRLEGLELLTCFFETASAIGTVGITLGITPGLGLVSRGIIVLLMFFGRVGGLTLIYASVSGNTDSAHFPAEQITVG